MSSLQRQNMLTRSVNTQFTLKDKRQHLCALFKKDKVSAHQKYFNTGYHLQLTPNVETILNPIKMLRMKPNIAQKGAASFTPAFDSENLLCYSG